MRVYVHIYDSCFYSLGTRPSHTEGKEGLVPRLLLLVLIITLPMTAHYCNMHAQNLGSQRAYPCSTIKDQSHLNQTVIIYYQDLMYIQQDSCTKQCKVLQKRFLHKTVQNVCIHCKINYCKIQNVWSTQQILINVHIYTCDLVMYTCNVMSICRLS